MEKLRNITLLTVIAILMSCNSNKSNKNSNSEAIKQSDIETDT
ncbi:hypothetical protein [Winogradskyella schleiferi]|nr:hypothetical protein [Winogradskyella schleiferi]